MAGKRYDKRQALGVKVPQAYLKKATIMRTIRPMLQGMGLLLVLWAVGTGCTYDTAASRLSLPEQAEFFLYQKVMTCAGEA